MIVVSSPSFSMGTLDHPIAGKPQLHIIKPVLNAFLPSLISVIRDQ